MIRSSYCERDGNLCSHCIGIGVEQLPVSIMRDWRNDDADPLLQEHAESVRIDAIDIAYKSEVNRRVLSTMRTYKIGVCASDADTRTSSCM